MASAGSRSSIDASAAERRYLAEPADTRTPEALYERWALALLERAVADARRGYADRGQAELFDVLKVYLGRDAAAVPYGELSGQLGRSEAALRTALSRLRARWRTRVRELVAETVHDGRLVDDELRDLLRMLSPS